MLSQLLNLDFASEARAKAGIPAGEWSLNQLYPKARAVKACQPGEIGGDCGYIL